MEIKNPTSPWSAKLMAAVGFFAVLIGQAHVLFRL